MPYAPKTRLMRLGCDEVNMQSLMRVLCARLMVSLCLWCKSYGKSTLKIFKKCSRLWTSYGNSYARSYGTALAATCPDPVTI